MLELDRIITTSMSANVVADLLKEGFTPQEMARAIKADTRFITGVQAKEHTFSERDLKSLAKLAGTTLHLLLFKSMRPVKPGLKSLFDAIRDQLEVSATFDTSFRRKNPKKRRTRTRAA